MWISRETLRKVSRSSSPPAGRARGTRPARWLAPAPRLSPAPRPVRRLPRRLSLIFVTVILGLLAATPLGARGVLLERPSEQTGAPMYPTRVTSFYTSTYSFNGHQVDVYYTDSDLDPPDTETSLSCGGEELMVVPDPEFEVRLIEVEGELIFFVWEETEETGESEESEAFDLCEYVGYFAERYRFFSSEFPENMRDRLPGVIES